METIKNFNTSHVTVYLTQRSMENRNFNDFNTSHVTVYRSNLNYYTSGVYNFNTSHVTVYQQQKVTITTKYCISIHPMLRFIWSV